MNAFKKGLVTTAAVAVPLAAMTPAMAAPVEGASTSTSASAHGAKTVWNDADYLKNHTEGAALRDHLRALGFQADLVEKGSWVYLAYDKSDADIVRAIEEYQPVSPAGSENGQDGTDRSSRSTPRELRARLRADPAKEGRHDRTER